MSEVLLGSWVVKPSTHGQEKRVEINLCIALQWSDYSSTEN